MSCTIMRGNDSPPARNRDLTALGEVGRAVSSTLDLRMVLKTIVDRAVDLSGTDGGSIFYFREELGTFELGETSGLNEEVVAWFRKLDILARETGLGEAVARRQVLQLPDLTKRPSKPLRDAAIEAGFCAALIVPLLGAEGPLGASPAAAPGGRIFTSRCQPHADLRRPICNCPRERPAVPRDRG
jgi:GAF domain-containing protein